MLPDTDSGEAGKLDVVGLALLPAGGAAVVFGLAELGTRREPRLGRRCCADRSRGCVLSGAFCLHALRIERPLLDVRLYANRVFAAASLTTFGLGAALFGAMILVPLYYQQVRRESVIDTGLLDGPQGIGDAGGDADRRPPDRALRRRARGALGVIVLSLSTVPLAFVGAHTSFVADLARAGRARRRHRASRSCRR